MRLAIAAALLFTLTSRAAPALAEEVIAVTADKALVTFDTATPQLIESTRVITGITGNVVAIDVRPADGMLYAVTDDSRLYRIDPATGSASRVSFDPFAVLIAGAR